MLTPFGKKQRIKGIEINGIDFKLSQYADDTTLILDGSEESFLESVILIETFGNISGLRLNIKKTGGKFAGKVVKVGITSLPLPVFFFCSLTNFRATIRLETLGTSALRKRYPLGYFL